MRIITVIDNVLRMNQKENAHMILSLNGLWLIHVTV